MTSPLRPFITLAYAQSLDGCLTEAPGRPTALSGADAQALTHRLRAENDAILVGIGTVLADNPRLTVRLADGPNPQPVILDGRLRTPPGCFLVSGHPKPAWVAGLLHADPGRAAALQQAGALLLPTSAEADGRISLPALLATLHQRGIRRLMVEGGAQVITAFLSRRLVDQVCITIAPRYLGGLNAIQAPLAALPPLSQVTYTTLGEDLIVWGQL